MGMFDDVRSSYPLFSPEEDQSLQTKDLDCVMTHYWIDPAGQLFEVSNRDAFDAYIDEVVQPRWRAFQWKPNGRRGHVRPDYRTALVKLYPSTWEGGWQDWPEKHVYFRHGRIAEVHDFKE